MSNQPGRIAYRVEGSWWVAYYALPNTMEGAIEIARIRMAVVDPNDDRKVTFMSLIQGFITEFLSSTTGEAPNWLDPVKAPEHEKAGRA